MCYIEQKTQENVWVNVSRLIHLPWASSAAQCINVQKKEYKIPDEEALIISKIDIIKESSITSEVDYKVYTKEGVLLDLSYCDSVNSDISYPIINYDLTKAYVFNSLNVDIFNKNDSFFNDICFKYDLSLKARREQIYTENSFCERNCIYSNINFTNSKVNCICSDYI